MLSFSGRHAIATLGSHVSLNSKAIHQRPPGPLLCLSDLRLFDKLVILTLLKCLNAFTYDLILKLLRIKAPFKYTLCHKSARPLDPSFHSIYATSSRKSGYPTYDSLQLLMIFVQWFSLFPVSLTTKYSNSLEISVMTTLCSWKNDSTFHLCAQYNEKMLKIYKSTQIWM